MLLVCNNSYNGICGMMFFFPFLPFLLHLIGILLCMDARMFIQWIITHYCQYFFSCSSCPRFGHWELRLVPVSFQYAPMLSVSIIYLFIFSILIYTWNTFKIANCYSCEKTNWLIRVHSVFVCSSFFLLLYSTPSKCCNFIFSPPTSVWWYYLKWVFIWNRFC